MGPVKRAAYILWMRAKCKAKKRGLEFDLNKVFVELALANGYCSITGIKFNLNEVRSKYSAFAASIDRIDPNKGYTELNCQIVCWIYNRAKGNGTHNEVLILAEAVMAVKKFDPKKLFKGKESVKEELKEAKAIKSGKITPMQYAKGEQSEKPVKKMACGGSTGRGDGIASKGKTKCKVI